MKDAPNWKLEGRNEPLGRSKKRWMDEPYQNFKIFGIDNPKDLANNRKERERLRGAVMAFNGPWKPKKKIVMQPVRDIFFYIRFCWKQSILSFLSIFVKNNQRCLPMRVRGPVTNTKAHMNRIESEKVIKNMQKTYVKRICTLIHYDFETRFFFCLRIIFIYYLPYSFVVTRKL